MALKAKTRLIVFLLSVALAVTVVVCTVGRGVGRATTYTYDCHRYGLGKWDDLDNTCDCFNEGVSTYLDCSEDDGGTCVCACGTGAYTRTTTLEAGTNQCVPTPGGVYMLSGTANGADADQAYCPPGMPSPPGCHVTDAASYVNDISGHAIFLPLKKLLPDVTGITDWAADASYPSTLWNWDYLDALMKPAVANGKMFSIALVISIQDGPFPIGDAAPDGPAFYLSSLPTNFEAYCNDGGNPATSCAPLFDYAIGYPNFTCLKGYLPMPWHPNVQQMWIHAASAIADHLRSTTVNDGGVPYYNYLTLVHFTGVSLFDEEMYWPTADPAFDFPADSGITCPPDPDSSTAPLAKDRLNYTALGTLYATYGARRNRR